MALTLPTFWLPKLTVVGVRDTAVAVPLRLTVCGLPAALSVIARLAVRVPSAVGRKVTLMMQVALAASVVPQVVVREKSPALVPVKPMLLMVMLPVPVLRRVTVEALLLVLTVRSAKVRDVGETLATGLVPVPVSATSCGLAGSE